MLLGLLEGRAWPVAGEEELQPRRHDVRLI